MAGKTGDDDGQRETETRSIETRKIRANPSLVSLAIARTGSKPAGVSSMDSKELIPGLCKGVLLDDDKVKFWIDEKLHENCFMVFPKQFYIEGNSSPLWVWEPYKEDCCGGPVEVQQVRLNDRLSWVFFRGGLQSYLLSPMITYEVVLHLMLTEKAYGWHEETSIDLILPNGTTQSRTEILETKPKGQLFEIPVGDFVANRELIGSIDVKFNAITDYYKFGLIIKGIIYRPKY